MWQILKAELKYNRVNFAIFLMVVPVAFIYGAYRPSNIPLLIATLMAFLAVNNWNAFRIREKREFQLVQLPVSVRQLAMARLLMVVIPPAFFIALSAALQAAVNPAGLVNPRVLLSLYGLVVLVFSLAFIFRDRFIGSKHLKQGKMLIVALVSLGLAANMYGLIVLRQAANLRDHPPALARAIAYVIENNPSTTTTRTVVFLAISLAAAFLTIVTFARRRTYIE